MSATGRRIRPVTRSANPNRTVASSDTPVKGSDDLTAPRAEPLDCVCPATLLCVGAAGVVLYWLEADDSLIWTFSL